MCLTLNYFDRKKTAKQDIVVYKSATVYGNPDHNMVITPFVGFIAHIGNTYFSKLVSNSCLFPMERSCHEGLHSYADVNSCPTYRAIIECIIPKGAKYYIGKFDDDISYASDTLIYVKFLKK